MRTTITYLLCALLALTGANAVAANFTDKSFGISIDVDDALSKQPLWRDLQFFTTEDHSAGLMIKRFYDLSVLDFLAELRDVGYRKDREGVVLGMTGEPIDAGVDSGRGVLVPVRGRISGQQVTGVLGAYSGQKGQGFIVVATARPQYWAAWEPRIRAMFESVRFVDFDFNSLVEDWENRLRGKSLKHETASTTTQATGGMFYGGARHSDLHLCSDGSVKRESGQVQQAQNPYMSFYGQSTSRSEGGRWFVTVREGAPTLIVRDGGDEQDLRLEYENETFMLNGVAYVITTNELCQ